MSPHLYYFEHDALYNVVLGLKRLAWGLAIQIIAIFSAILLLGIWIASDFDPTLKMGRSLQIMIIAFTLGSLLLIFGRADCLDLPFTMSFRRYAIISAILPIGALFLNLVHSNLIDLGVAKNPVKILLEAMGHLFMLYFLVKLCDFVDFENLRRLSKRILYQQLVWYFVNLFVIVYQLVSVSQIFPVREIPIQYLVWFVLGSAMIAFILMIEYCYAVIRIRNNLKYLLDHYEFTSPEEEMDEDEN